MDHKKISFTAFNINTGKRESFDCIYSTFSHDSKEDAASSKLWYGESWSRRQMENAEVQIMPERDSVADEAWFIVRTANTLSGIQRSQVQAYLIRSASCRIRSDAEQIQHDHAMPTANAVQKACVGRLCNSVTFEVDWPKINQ